MELFVVGSEALGHSKGSGVKKFLGVQNWWELNFYYGSKREKQNFCTLNSKRKYTVHYLMSTQKK